MSGLDDFGANNSPVSPAGWSRWCVCNALARCLGLDLAGLENMSPGPSPFPAGYLKAHLFVPPFPRLAQIFLRQRGTRAEICRSPANRSLTANVHGVSARVFLPASIFLPVGHGTLVSVILETCSRLCSCLGRLPIPLHPLHRGAQNRFLFGQLLQLAGGRLGGQQGRGRLTALAFALRPAAETLTLPA